MKSDVNAKGKEHRIIINYQYLIQLGKEEIKKSNYPKADYYIYLSLLSPNNNLFSIISATSLRSFIYFEEKNGKMLLYLSMKILKIFNLILKHVDDAKTLMEIFLILYRTGMTLNNAHCNAILPFYLLSVGKRLIKIKNIELEANYKQYFDIQYKKCKSVLKQELGNIKQSYYDILSINGEEFRSDEKESLYSVIDELIKGNNYDNKGKDIRPGEECYLISNKWLRRYTQFMAKIRSFRDSPINYNIFLNKGFDTMLQYDNFIEEESKIYGCPYVCSINNFWIEQLKDSWMETEDDYANVFIKTFISESEYSILNKNQWEELVKNFGCVNEIKRYKLPNGEIETHLKRIRVMILNKSIMEKKPNMIRPKVIQISKEATINDFISKMKTCVKEYGDIDSNILNLYKIDLNSMPSQQRKQCIFEIMIAYTCGINSIKLKCQKIIHTNRSIESYWYCSKKCELKDIDHLSYHEQFSRLFITKTTINELNNISFQEILPNYSIVKHGKAILTDSHNKTYINSILQCLSHCQELTKYFLTERYTEEICINSNNKTNRRQVAQAYHEILKQLWNGGDLILNSDDFINALTKSGFNINLNHNSYDFLLFLLDIFTKYLNRSSFERVTKNKLPKKIKTDVEIGNYFWRLHQKKEDSLIAELFHGQLKNTITCSQCNKSTITYEPYNCLSLPIDFKLYKVKFMFFPLMNKGDSNSQIKLIFYQYEITTSEQIRANDFISVIMANHNQLSRTTLLLDFVLLKPNKQFAKIIQIPKNTIQDASEIYDYVMKGYRLAIYQRSNTLKNIYVYPCEFVSKTKLLFIPYVNIEFISYPFAIQMDNNETVNDCYSLIQRVLKKLFLLTSIKHGNYKQFLLNNSQFITKDNEDLELFRLFLYNNKANYNNDLTSNIWDYYLKDSSDNNSWLCDFCGQHCDYCSLLKRFHQNETFEYILSHLANDRPLIIYAQMLSFDRTASLYNDDDLISTSGRNSSLSSPIEVQSDISIYDCLDIFQTETVLEHNEYNCIHCKNTTEATKHLQIFIPPHYLILRIDRFAQSNTSAKLVKNNTYVNYPIKGLNLNNYVLGPLKDKAIYDLWCVNLLDGSIESGKYYSICKYFDKWLQLSDIEAQIEDNNNSNCNAYILFYRRREYD